MSEILPSIVETLHLMKNQMAQQQRAYEIQLAEQRRIIDQLLDKMSDLNYFQTAAFNPFSISKISPPPGFECNNIAEVNVFDPFISIPVLTKFDGNPSISFTAWLETFHDALMLVSDLNEEQKFARLKLMPTGKARDEFNGVPEPPQGTNKTLNWVIEQLRPRLENGASKMMARQQLSLCRQAPGEAVHRFAARLNETLKAAMNGQPEAAVQQRLFDEFLDRLDPELQYKVKSMRPETYVSAYEIAQHLELLEKSNQIILLFQFIHWQHKLRHSRPSNVSLATPTSAVTTATELATTFGTARSESSMNNSEDETLGTIETGAAALDHLHHHQ
jgi:hypothetical protein